MKWRLILILLLLAPGPPAMAQDAWRQRLWREQVVAAYGPVTRPLVETFGDDGCAAVSACSWHVGVNLAWFYNCGGLAATLRPVELLRAISQHGDPVAWYVTHHDLRGLDELDGFLSRPLDIAIGIYPLETAVAEVRVKRMRGGTGKVVFGFTGFALLVCVFVWWRRRQHGPAGAA